jgi:ABC-type polysaccharide transport system permease subunit
MAIAQKGVQVAPAQPTRRANWRIYWGRTWPLYAMLVLPLLQLAIFHYYPMYGVVIAFQNFNPGKGFSGSPWVGLEIFAISLPTRILRTCCQIH